MATCLANHFYSAAVRDAAALLASQGCTVSVPEGQTCCGQPALNAGYSRQAAVMAAHTADVFKDAEHIVFPSGSCAAMVRTHYAHLPVSAADWGARSSQLAGRAFELSEFLVEVLGISSLGNGLEGRRIALHPGCHGLRDLGLKDEAAGLLQQSGAELVYWEAAMECCGFGGLFSAKMAPVSLAMADRKLDTLPVVDCLTSMDAGCLLQLGGRLQSRRLGIPVVHLATLYREAAGVSA